MSFETAKEEYKRERLNERKKLHDHLLPFTTNKAHFLYGYTPKFGGVSGKGRTDYTNNGEIVKFDLSNWVWLTLEKDTDLSHEDITVYFQSINYDHRTKNWHALVDRLSFSFEEIIGTRSKQIMIETDIDLPLDKVKMDKLLDIMSKEYKIFYKKK